MHSFEKNLHGGAESTCRPFNLALQSIRHKRGRFIRQSWPLSRWIDEWFAHLSHNRIYAVTTDLLYQVECWSNSSLDLSVVGGEVWETRSVFHISMPRWLCHDGFAAPVADSRTSSPTVPYCILPPRLRQNLCPLQRAKDLHSRSKWHRDLSSFRVI